MSAPDVSTKESLTTDLPAPAPIAAIDVGSNTIHLVVAQPDSPAARRLDVLADDTELVRFGADIHAAGRVGPERLARAIAIIRAQLDRAGTLGARLVIGVATEGVRAAANADDILDGIARETGLRCVLISGDQEAALTYWGATSDAQAPAPKSRGRSATSHRRAVIDLGGGSIELVVGHEDAIEWRVSLPIGSGAMHDEYASDDPPTAEQLGRVQRIARARLDPLAVPLPVDVALACGGAATTLAWLALKADEVPDPVGAEPLTAPRRPQRRLGALTAAHFDALIALTREMTAEQIHARYGIAVERARLLGAGAAVLRAAMERLAVDRLEVTMRGIREGAIIAYEHAGDAWPDAARAGGAWQ